MSPELEKWMKRAAMAAPVVAVASLTLPQALGLLGKETVRELMVYTFQWGPAMLVLCALYVLTVKFLGEFVKSQADQAVAMSQVANAVEHMADRDSVERREIRIALSVMSQKVDELHSERSEHFRRHSDMRSLVQNEIREQKEENRG